MIFKTSIWVQYHAVPNLSVSNYLLDERISWFILAVNFILSMFAVSFFYYTMKNSIILAEDITTVSNNSSTTEFIINNSSSKIIPKNAYQRELIQHFYSSSTLDPYGYYMEMYRIFQTNEKYLIYWYLTYCDVVTSSVPWTEESIHKACLQLNIQYLVNIVLAAKAHFLEFNSDWVPPTGYLNSKMWHPWLQYGPNFYGVIPTQVITEASTTGLVENLGLEPKKLPTHMAYCSNDFKTAYQMNIFNRYKNYPADMFSQVYHIFNSNERYLLYWYVNYCDLAMHSKPWDEFSMHNVCLAVADPQFIIDVVNAGKANIPNFTGAWQPPTNYLVEKIWHPWLSHAPNFSGMTPEEMAISYCPSNANERMLLDKFFLHGGRDKAIYEHIFHMFYSNERHLLYQYVLYYDPVMLGKGPWTEEQMFKICINLDPQFMMDVVTAAKAHLPDFSSTWTPDPDYLEFSQWAPWMEYGPWMIFDSGYIYSTLMLIFMYYAIGFWSLFHDEED